MSQWRVGQKIKLNVYEDDRPVCQCHSEGDAERIVSAMNAKEYMSVRVARMAQMMMATAESLGFSETDSKPEQDIKPNCALGHSWVCDAQSDMHKWYMASCPYCKRCGKPAPLPGEIRDKP